MSAIALAILAHAFLHMAPNYEDPRGRTAAVFVGYLCAATGFGDALMQIVGLK
jgi:hypothetical protein